jgi:ABC-2 type transport system ATP-binding protein
VTLIVHNLYIQRSATFSLMLEKLVVSAGELLCITGPNGCGKTTLMECLAGMLRPGNGTILLDGQPVTTVLQPVRAAIGYVPDDEAWLIAELCADEYFSLLCRVYRKAGVATDMQTRTVQLAGQLHFTALRQPLGKLSHGNKKKVQLIAALMHRPKLLIIDELRNGLDPLAIIAAEALVREALQDGSIVVAATHDLWWAERLAAKVLLLVNGQLTAYDRTAQLVQAHGSLEALFVAKTREAHDAR